MTRTSTLALIPRRPLAALGVLAIFGAACGGDLLPPDDASGNPFVVQVVSASPKSQSVTCGPASLNPLVIDVHVVNTTKSEVTLLNVAGEGYAFANGTPGALLVKADTLAFTPMVLRAKDGDAITHVTMPVPCSAVGKFAAILELQTTSGKYPSLAVIVDVGQ